MLIGIYWLREYSEEIVSQLEVPVLKFQETNLNTVHHIRCNLKKPFQGGSPRNDLVWIVAGNEEEFGALRRRLPGQLQCLFKLSDLIKKICTSTCLSKDASGGGQWAACDR
jgi:hypothetical protein